jgi:beta-glucosidase
MSFSKDFTWGAAAASYQIEGAAYTDGKGLSVWDTFCRQPGKIDFSDTGDVACDHYHRYAEDVDLMAEIGLQAYRLSLSWPRILPNGTGKVNATGIDFYDKLIDALLAKNITPWVTLFHWDYPHELFCRGGWLNRDSADWFAEYTAVVVDKLSDRVKHWMPQNEPQCYLGLGHLTGEHAPGLQLGFPDYLTAIHHSHLAHGKAVQVIRSQAKLSPEVGCAIVGFTKMPASNAPADVETARQAMFATDNRHYTNVSWFADPLILGKYPEAGIEFFGKDMPKIQPGDMATIAQPLDFFGVNIYEGCFVKAGMDGERIDLPPVEAAPVTGMDWQITPSSLYWGPKFLYERYKLPIVITENGMANTDFIQLNGKVHDPQRIDFLTRYLRELKRAAADGVPIDAYFLWSIMDNFEWSFGYKRRFGLTYIDHLTKDRVLKDSAFWYREIIKNNGKEL